MGSPDATVRGPWTGKLPEISHLEGIRKDLRDEIKQRIRQRDQYIIQMSLGLAAVVWFAVSQNNPDLVILAPPVSIFYTWLIAYSYKIHGLQTTYLRDVIEVRLAKLCGEGLETEIVKEEWENWYEGHHRGSPGIRRVFFKWCLWSVCLISPMVVLYFHLRNGICSAIGSKSERLPVALLILSLAIYALLALRVGRDVSAQRSHSREV